MTPCRASASRSSAFSAGCYLRWTGFEATTSQIFGENHRAEHERHADLRVGFDAVAVQRVPVVVVLVGLDREPAKRDLRHAEMLLLPEELAFCFDGDAQDRVHFGESSGVLERKHVVVAVPVGVAVVGAGEIGVEDLFSPGKEAEFAVHVRFRFVLCERGRAEGTAGSARFIACCTMTVKKPGYERMLSSWPSDE